MRQNPKRDLDLIHYVAANYSFFNAKSSIVENVEIIYNNLVTACTTYNNCYIGNIFTEDRINYTDNYLTKQNIFNITQTQLQNFKYALWQEYIAQHHYEPELDQARAHFEMWIYKQSPLFNDFEQRCNANTLKELEELELSLAYHSPFFSEFNNKCFATEELEEAKYLLSNLKKNLESSFELFAADMKTKFFSKALFNNQKYMQDKALQYHDLYFSKLTEASYIKHNGFWDFLFGLRGRSQFMNKALDYIGDAVRLDIKQAWNQYNTQGIVLVQKAYHTENLRMYDQRTVERCAEIKQNVVDYFYNSLDLRIVSRDEYDSSFIVLSSSKQLNASLDLFAQYGITRGILNAQINATQNAANFIIEKAADPHVCIRVESTITNYDLANNMNVTQALVEAAQLHPEIFASLNSSSSLNKNFAYANNSIIIKDVVAQLDSNYGFVSPVFSTYTLEEEDDDIFDKIFVTVFAVVQIVAGFTVLATFGGAGAFFANSMGLSMIMSGLGDLVMVADSIINDYPIDLDNYFKSKAVTYAVAVITAGLMHGFKIDVLGAKALGGAEAFKNGALQTATVFKYALGMQAVSSLVGYAASYGANKIAKSNQGDANSDSESMSSNIVTKYNNQLFIIYMASLLPEYSNLFTSLQNDAYLAAGECSKRFNDPAFSIFKQTSSTFVTHSAAAGGGIVGATIGAVAGTAISSSLGALKYNEYAGEFDDNYTPYIMNSYVQAENALQALGGNKILLQNKLSYDFNEIQVTQIIGQMTNDSFIINNQVNYNNCTGISTLNQTLYSVNLDDVEKICTKVTLGYTKEREALRQAIKQAIKNGMTSTLSTDVLSPMLNTAGHYIYENVKKWVKEKIDTYKTEQEFRNLEAENKLKKLYPGKREEDKIEAYERGAGDKNKKGSTKQKQENQQTTANSNFKDKRVYGEAIELKQQDVQEINIKDKSLGNVAKEYLYKKLEEHIKSGKAPDIFEMGKAVIGLEMELIGSAISDLKQEYPKSAAFLDKVLDIVNTPGEWVAKGVVKTYGLAKAKLLDFVKENYGETRANSLNNKIYGGEQEIAAGVAKFAPSENQAEVLKTLELIGLGKAAKEVFKLTTKDLVKAEVTKKIDLDTLHKRTDVPDHEVKSYQNILELRKQLLVEEQVSAAKAAGIFDNNGILKPEVVSKSKVVVFGQDLKDPQVIRQLTSDGSNINDWAKFRTTEPLLGPRGRFDWHFYYNKVTGKINTNSGYKPKPVGDQTS